MAVDLIRLYLMKCPMRICWEYIAEFYLFTRQLVFIAWLKCTEICEKDSLKTTKNKMPVLHHGKLLFSQSELVKICSNVLGTRRQRLLPPSLRSHVHLCSQTARRVAKRWQRVTVGEACHLLRRSEPTIFLYLFFNSRSSRSGIKLEHCTFLRGKPVHYTFCRKKQITVTDKQTRKQLNK